MELDLDIKKVLDFTYHEEDRAEYPYVFDISSDNQTSMDIIPALMQLRSLFREVFPVHDQDQLDNPWDNRRYLFGAGQVAFQHKKDAALFRLAF